MHRVAVLGVAGFAAASAAASPVPHDVCALEKATGPCRAAMPRWWFNSATGACEGFIYGGCGGNGNNFETPAQCESSCTPPPPVVGLPVHPCPPTMINPSACACGTQTTTDAHGCARTMCKAPVACVASMPACRPGCSDCKVTTVTEGSCSQCAVYKAECRDVFGLPAGLPGPCAVGPCAAGELCTDVSGGMHTCAPKPHACCMAAATCGISLTVPSAESSTPCTQAEHDAGSCTSHAICCHRVYCRAPPPCPPAMINPSACACGTEATTDAHGCARTVCKVCPPVVGLPVPQCGAHEERKQCGTACQNYCGRPAVVACTRQCIVNQCECKDGMVRATDSPTAPCVAACPVVAPPATTTPTDAATDAPLAADVCSLPKEVGRCRAAIPRWFFNAQSRRCERFTYGGCGGNANNFASEEACVDGAEECLAGTAWRGCKAPRAVPNPTGYDCNRKGWCARVGSPSDCAALKAGNCDGADCAGAVYLAKSRRCRLCASVKAVRSVAKDSKYALAATKSGAPAVAPGGAVAPIVAVVVAVAASAAACIVVARRRIGAQPAAGNDYTDLPDGSAEKENIDV